MDLLNPAKISRLDSKNMLSLLIAFPRQCEDALFIGERADIRPSHRKKYRNIVFTGLGGSAIGGDIVHSYVQGEVGVPILVNRNYTIPDFVGRDSLVFAVSYSGNTEETLSAYAAVKKKRAKTVVITSNGKLKNLAIKNTDILVVVPEGYPPRCALGYSFIPAVVLLSKLGVIKDRHSEIMGAASFLDRLREKSLGPLVNGQANLAKRVATDIHDRFAVIYAAEDMESVATRWRGEFAENSKALSSTHVFPEMNHNEIVGWAHPAGLLKDFIAIILEDKDDHPRIKRRMNITSSILKKSGFKVTRVQSRGKSRLERILSLVYTGDFASFYLAMLNGIDPTPVDRITYLKKQLAK